MKDTNEFPLVDSLLWARNNKRDLLEWGSKIPFQMLEYYSELPLQFDNEVPPETGLRQAELYQCWNLIHCFQKGLSKGDTIKELERIHAEEESLKTRLPKGVHEMQLFFLSMRLANAHFINVRIKEGSWDFMEIDAQCNSQHNEMISRMFKVFSQHEHRVKE